MIVLVPTFKREIDFNSFSDITLAPITVINAIEAGLEMDFNGDLTAEEVTRVKIRCASADAAEEQMLLNAYQAIAQIKTFNNKATPTNAEVLAEVKLLGQAVIRLIQRVLGDYSL